MRGAASGDVRSGFLLVTLFIVVALRSGRFRFLRKTLNLRHARLDAWQRSRRPFALPAVWQERYLIRELKCFKSSAGVHHRSAATPRLQLVSKLEAATESSIQHQEKTSNEEHPLCNFGPVTRDRSRHGAGQYKCSGYSRSERHTCADTEPVEHHE